MSEKEKSLFLLRWGHGEVSGYGQLNVFTLLSEKDNILIMQKRTVG